jgi:L-asparaginase
MKHYTTIQIPTKASPGSTSILMIYTGGTLGMVYDPSGKQLIPFNFEQIPEQVPELDRFDFALTVIAWQHPIDSSNVTPEQWIELATLIHENYALYDGFVILHGTDTMAYSASAISYLLENLNKPVIFTGSQLPIGAVRTDARENLITALEIASAKDEQGHPVVSEVCIYFNSLLLRGNRAKKVESTHFNAFYSENYPSLAEAGVTIEFNRAVIQPYEPGKTLSLQATMDNHVAVIKLFPGISPLVLESLVAIKELKGVVLETYGSGNAPTDAWFIDCLTKAIKRGIVILNVSQCIGGQVMQGRYQTSRQLEQIGVLSGSDMTTEAAVTKLMYLLGQKLSIEQLRTQVTRSIRGEMS